MATMSAIVASHEQEQEQKQELVNEFLKKIDAGNTKVMTRFTDYEKIMEKMTEVVRKHKLDFQSYETKTKIFLDDVAMKTFLDKIDLDMSNIIMEANDMMRSYKSMAQIKTSVTENVIPSRTYASVTMPITPTQSNLVSVPSGNWADDVDADDDNKRLRSNIQTTIEDSFITDIIDGLVSLFDSYHLFMNYTFLGFLNAEDYSQIRSWDKHHEVGVLSTVFKVINKCFDKFMKETCDNAVVGEYGFATFTSKAHTNTIMYKDNNDRIHCIYLDKLFIMERSNGYELQSYSNAKKYAESKKMMVKFYHDKDFNVNNCPPSEFIHDDVNNFNHVCGWKFTPL